MTQPYRGVLPNEAIEELTSRRLREYERKIGKLRQQMLKADGALACEAIFTIGLFDLERRRLIEPTPAWAYAVGLEPPDAPAAP